jgi:hypothetical protein
MSGARDSAARRRSSRSPGSSQDAASAVDNTMTVLLAIIIGIAMVLLVTAMLAFVPAGTKRVRRRGDTNVDPQGAELTPEDRSG